MNAVHRIVRIAAVAGALGLLSTAAWGQGTAPQSSKPKTTAAKAATSQSSTAKPGTPSVTTRSTTRAKTSTRRATSARSATSAKSGAKNYMAACKDGTQYSGPSRTKACSAHGGVKAWK